MANPLGIICVRMPEMRGVRRASLVSVSLAVLGLAACGTNPPPDGTVTGVASPCVGPPITSTQYSHRPVTVYLTKGSRTVAQQIVKGTHIYRFAVPAGSYVVATHEGEASKPVAVTMRSGQTTHADIPSYCP